MTETQAFMAVAPLLTLQEVAAFLHVSAATVRRLVDRGVLRVHRIARRLRFRPEDLTALLESGASFDRYER